MAQTANQGGLNLDTSLVLNGLNQPDIEMWVHDFTGGYNKFSVLLERISQSRRIVGRNGQFSKMIQGLFQVSATVATSTQGTATTVVLTWTDPNYNFFDIYDNVTLGPSTNVRYRVVANSPGSITVQSEDGVTAISSASFVAGNTIYSQWNSQPAYSTGRKTIYEVPQIISNYTETTRDTCRINRKDEYLTYAKDPMTGEDTAFWSFTQEKLMMQRFARKREFKALWGTYNYNASDRTAYNGGLFWAIQDPSRGGVVQPFASVWVLNDFINFITQIAARYNDAEQNIMLLCGRQFLKILQSYTQPYIQYSGVNNTFGGHDVDGLDVREFTIAGIKCGFTILPSLSSTDFYPPTTIAGLSGTQAENFCFAVDMKNYPIIPDGNGLELPPLEKVYSGRKPILYGAIKGLIDHEGNTGEFSAQDTGFISTADDSITFEVLCDDGIDAVAYHMGVMYPTN